MGTKKKTWQAYIEMKANNEKIAMLTAYDYSSAVLAETAGLDILLVGDSLGMVVLGYENTLQVTLEDMIYHTKSVMRGAKNTMVVTDMPFGSYETSVEEGVKNAIKIIKEAGCDGVKIEGGTERCDLVQAITLANVPVVGHIGLTPQKIIQMGQFKVQGKTLVSAQKLMEDAKNLAQAGAVMLVLECVPAVLAKKISQAIAIPTIGIGAGPNCDGQVLVWYDMVGMYDALKPKFVKHFAEAGTAITQAMVAYSQEVKKGTFPGEEHCFAMSQGQEDISRLY